MARIFKEEDYAMRQNEILNAAQKLVYSKGYESMSIQDILDDLQISKGAFYHYFDSKQALLEALVCRMMQEAENLLSPIVEDPDLPALDKLRRFFDTAVNWKTSQKTFLIALLRVWYTDNNAIVRLKVTAEGNDRFTPLLTTIICQGIQEGVFTSRYPDQVGAVVLALILNLGETFSRRLLSIPPDFDGLQEIENIIAAYTDAIEQVLGAQSGAIKLFEMDRLKEWIVATDAETR